MEKRDFEGFELRMSSMGGCVFYSATIPGQWITSTRISITGDCMSLSVRFPRMLPFQYSWSWHSRNCNYFPCFVPPWQPLGSKISSLCVRFYSTFIVRGTLLTTVGDIVHSMKARIVECNSVPNMNSALRKAQYKWNMITNKFKKMENNTGKEITTQEIMLSKLESNRCKNISKTAVRKIFGPQ